LELRTPNVFFDLSDLNVTRALLLFWPTRSQLFSVAKSEEPICAIAERNSSAMASLKLPNFSGSGEYIIVFGTFHPLVCQGDAFETQTKRLAFI